MRNTALILSALLVLPFAAFAAEFKDKGETIAVDFPAGWNGGKSDDPTVTLKLEKGKAFFEFSKQDSELGDYYLKARVKEQVDSLRSKGTSLSGDVSPVNLHGVSTAYYTSYESMGAQAYIAFFTYNGASYAISARGLDDGDFRAVMASIRKPGEKIELPKPRKVRVARRKARKEEDEEQPGVQVMSDGSVEVSSSAAALASTDTVAAVPVSTEAAPAAVEPGTASLPSAKGLLNELSEKTASAGQPPYIPRRPLPFLFWGVLIALWVGGSMAARKAAAAYKNPKLPPPPADVPPDFFFPFIISRASSTKEDVYNVITRQKQLLAAEYPCEHSLFLAAGVYGCVLLHVVWSLLAFVGKGDLLTGMLLRLPLGRLWASVPEIFFVLLFFYGLYLWFARKREFRLYDAQSNLVLEVKPELAYGLMKDGAGKEVARLVAKGGMAGRCWDFVDTDNLVVFTIKDDFPKGYLLGKFFGNLGGALRSHYGIYAQDRRAGYIFLDPHSGDNFQIHMDFAFARLGHPAQILAAMLYIVSREKTPVYPSPF